MDLTLYGTVPTTIPPAPGPGAVGSYSWAGDETVPKSHHAYVMGHVRRLARRHRLGEVRIRYFGPPRDGGDFSWTAPEADAMLLGFVIHERPGEIALRAELRGEILEGVIAHEVGHLIQRRAGHPLDEADASAFAARYILGRR